MCRWGPTPPATRNALQSGRPPGESPCAPPKSAARQVRSNYVPDLSMAGQQALRNSQQVLPRIVPTHLVQYLDVDQAASAAGGCVTGWPDGRGSGSAPDSGPTMPGRPFGSPMAGGRWRSAPPTPPASTAGRWRAAPGQQPPPPQPPPPPPPAEQAVQPLRSDDPWGGQDVPPPTADAGARPALQRGALQAALASVAVEQQSATPQHAAPPPPPAVQHQRQQQQHAELARVLGPDVARVAGLLPPQRQQPAHGPAAQQAAPAPKTLHLPSTRPLHKPVAHQQGRGGSSSQHFGSLPQPHDPEQPKQRQLSLPNGAIEQQHQQRRQPHARQQLPATPLRAGPAMTGEVPPPVPPRSRAAQATALLAEVSLGRRAAPTRGAPGSISGAQAGADLLRLVQQKPPGGASDTGDSSTSATASPAAATASSADETGGDVAAAHTLTGRRPLLRRQLRAQAYRAGDREAGPGAAAAPPPQPGGQLTGSRAATPSAPAPQQRRNHQTSGQPGSGSSAHTSGHAPHRPSPQPPTPVLKVRRGSSGMLEVIARSPTAAAAAPVAGRSRAASHRPTTAARTTGDGRDAHG